MSQEKKIKIDETNSKTRTKLVNGMIISILNNKDHVQYSDDAERLFFSNMDDDQRNHYRSVDSNFINLIELLDFKLRFKNVIEWKMKSMTMQEFNQLEIQASDVAKAIKNAEDI
jgi:hypothetical protein